MTDACLKTTTTLFDDDTIANFDAVIVDRSDCCSQGLVDDDKQLKLACHEIKSDVSYAYDDVLKVCIESVTETETVNGNVISNVPSVVSRENCCKQIGQGCVGDAESTRTFTWNKDLNTCVQTDQTMQEGAITAFTAESVPKWVCCAAGIPGVDCPADNIPAGFVAKYTVHDDPKSFNDA